MYGDLMWYDKAFIFNNIKNINYKFVPRITSKTCLNSFNIIKYRWSSLATN